MGEKMVRDNHEACARADGVSGSWRTASHGEAVRALARKLTEEASGFSENHDPAELWDAYDVLSELMLMTGADRAEHRLKHLAKLEEHGGFGKHVMWNPVPERPQGLIEGSGRRGDRWDDTRRWGGVPQEPR